jgi:hypothetical protein
MFRRTAIATAIASVAAFFIAARAHSAPAVGQKAPDFSAKDLSGKTVKLSDYAGKYVVLEWVNPGCPFVKKHYNSANLPGLQKEFTAKNVVWLAINSTETGHVDYLSPDKLGQRKSRGAHRYLDGRKRPNWPNLRRQNHAAHVHRQPARQLGLCRRHRQHRLRARGRRAQSHQLCAGGVD